MSPNQVTLVALLPYLIGAVYLGAASVNLMLLGSQIKHYVRVGQRRGSGERVLAAMLVGNAVLYLGLTSVAYWPSKQWLIKSIEDHWDWVLTWGLGVYLAGALALAVASGAVFFALTAWSVPNVLAQIRNAAVAHHGQATGGWRSAISAHTWNRAGRGVR
ncbi:Uncharacterised protein [Mycobacteroides abscessus subsp. bolletii]|nr:Uncharacterised protein [Mycobacteroides abscessus subsp. bolletii]SKX37248.1 Uncharacterised protein [Mycobacteroides abscessus subsp. bolletii]